jgi:hypothetical protein
MPFKKGDWSSIEAMEDLDFLRCDLSSSKYSVASILIDRTDS